MDYNANEIYEMLEAVLGNDADGIYACERENDGDLDDCPIFSDTDFCWQVDNRVRYNNGYIDVKHGATRIVFIPNNKDYVIKMSITGYYDFDNIDIPNAYDIASYPEYLRMYKLLNSGCDLMFEENEIRDAACEELQSILLPNIYIGEWHQMSVYIQQKVATTFRDVRSSGISTPSESKTREEIYNSIDCLGDSFEESPLFAAFVYDLLEIEGTEQTKIICDELYRLDISDLHGNNVGYTTDGECVIFDYAGFDEEYLYTEVCEYDEY